MTVMCEINRKVFLERVAKLVAIGLPELDSILRPNPWKFDPDSVILGLDNKAIVCRNGWGDHIAKTASKLLGYNIESHDFERDGAQMSFFVCLSITSIPVPERRAMDVLTRYFDHFLPGIEADSECVNIPKGLSAYGAPVAFVEETDAYEAAEVLAVVTAMDTDVIKTDEGYGVVIRNAVNMDNYNGMLVTGACEVLQNYSVSRKEKALLETFDDYEGAALWQKNIGERYTQQERIEAKVDRLLSLIDDTQSGEQTVTRPFESSLMMDEILLRLDRIENKLRLPETDLARA